MMNMEQLEVANVKRETEKAVLIEVCYGDDFKKDVWFPKSQVEIKDEGVWASSWILDQKSIGSRHVATVGGVCEQSNCF